MDIRLWLVDGPGDRIFLLYWVRDQPATVLLHLREKISQAWVVLNVAPLLSIAGSDDTERAAGERQCLAQWHVWR